MTGGQTCALPISVSIKNLEEIKKERKTNIVSERKYMMRREVGRSKEKPKNLLQRQYYVYRDAAKQRGYVESYYEIWEETGEVADIIVGPSQDGIIHYDIRLMGLEEAMKDAKSHNNFLSYLGSQNEWIFKVYKDKNIDMNFENVFKIWEEIGIKCEGTPGDKGIFREIDRLKNSYEKYKK